MAKRKAAKRKARAPEPVDETTEEYWDEEESSSTWSSSESETSITGDDGSSVSAPGGRFRLERTARQRRMKTVKPKPLKTLMGNDLSKPRKRKITLLKE